MILTTCLTALAATPLVLAEVSSQPCASSTTAARSSITTSDPAVDARFTPQVPGQGVRNLGLVRSLATVNSRDAEAPKQKTKYEPIQFKTQDKLTIHGRLYTPRKSGRAPAALLVHDAGKDAESLKSIADNLQRKGFVVLALDLRGHGKSTTEACDWSNITDAHRLAKVWTFAIRDLEAATEYLRDLKDVHSSNLSVIGVGAGAVLAARYATRDENARAVALIEPKPEIYGFNMMRDVTDLGGLPVMIMSTEAGRAAATRIKNGAAKANEGLDFVKLHTLKPKKDGDIFTDKRLNAELAKFLRAEAMDRR